MNEMAGCRGWPECLAAEKVRRYSTTCIAVPNPTACDIGDRCMSPCLCGRWAGACRAGEYAAPGSGRGIVARGPHAAGQGRAVDGHLRRAAARPPRAGRARGQRVSEAAVVEELEVIPVSSLAKVAAFLAGHLDTDPVSSRLQELFNTLARYDDDDSDVRGQELAKPETMQTSDFDLLISISAFGRGSESTACAVLAWQQLSKPSGNSECLNFVTNTCPAQIRHSRVTDSPSDQRAQFTHSAAGYVPLPVSTQSLKCLLSFFFLRTDTTVPFSPAPLIRAGLARIATFALMPVRTSC